MPDDENFINIYAHLLIINELRIEQIQKDQLTTYLLRQNNITIEEINQIVADYKNQPEEWVTFLQNVRDRITAIKSENIYLDSGDTSAINKSDQ